MPLTDEQKQALATLTEADATEVADALQSESQDHYQAIYQRGFSTAHNDAKAKLEAKEKEVEAAQATVKEKEEALSNVKDGDVKALNERNKKLEESNQQLTKQLEEVKGSKHDLAKSYARRQFESEIVNELVADSVDKDFASVVLPPKFRDNIVIDLEEKDGEIVPVRKYLADDGVTPLQASPKELARAAATKIKSGVDPKWITSDADKGGGSASGNGKASNGYDPVKAGKAMAEKQKAAGDNSMAFK